MNIKKVFLFFALSGCFSLIATAQLSTGETSSHTFRSGNRAQSGDYGMYLGAKTSVFKELFDDSFDLAGTLPLLNFKYMQSDNVELRAGVELYRASRVLKGAAANNGGDIKFNEVKARNFVYPGMAYHFSNRNLLDVFVGAELPIGWSRDKTTGSNASGTTISSRMSFHMGVGTFAGLQAYIANLPFAVGFEYGISFLTNWGQKYKNETSLTGQNTVISYTPDPDVFPEFNNMTFDSLNARKTDLGSQMRITITYFFKRY